jgi:hypothetical protein
MSTCATPARAAGAGGSSSTPIDRQLASGLSSFDDTPIFMIRLVADSGGIIQGGLAHVGRVGVTCASRSWTSCLRAASRPCPS